MRPRAGRNVDADRIMLESTTELQNELLLLFLVFSTRSNTGTDYGNAVTHSGTSKNEGTCNDTCVFIPNQIPFARGWRTKRRTVQLTNLHVHMVLDEALTSTAEGSDLYYALHLENTS